MLDLHIFFLGVLKSVFYNGFETSDCLPPTRLMIKGMYYKRTMRYNKADATRVALTSPIVT
jgi:hypothetical protein